MAAYRKTRFHDEKGNLAPPGELVRFPLIVVQALLRRLTGRRPVAPLIPHGARRAVAALLTPKSRVVEFGAGNSTRWLAARVGALTSFETDEGWFRFVAARLPKRDGVAVVFWDGKDFSVVAGAEGVDLWIVDGVNRVACIEFALRHIHPGAALYLDNSDKDMAPPDPDREMRVCERLVREFAERSGRPLTWFTGFAPAQAYAEQGLLMGPRRIRRPSPSDPVSRSADGGTRRRPTRRSEAD